jgi:hypothetical protein
MKLFQHIAYVSVILCIGLACEEEPVGPDCVVYAFPASLGNTWTYENVWGLVDSAQDTSTHRATLIRVDTAGNGTISFTVEDSSRYGTWHSEYEQRADGLYLMSSASHYELLWKRAAAGGAPDTTVPQPLVWPRCLLPGRLCEGESWVYDSVPAAGSVGNEAVLREYGGRAIVEVGAGTFDCHVIRGGTSGGLSRDEYYTGIGLARSEYRCSTDVMDYDSLNGTWVVVGRGLFRSSRMLMDYAVVGGAP